MGSERSTDHATSDAKHAMGNGCLIFEGEGHGLRRADTMCRCLEAELLFYARVFGFEPADALAPVEIRNL